MVEARDLEEVAAPAARRDPVPLAIAILAALFAVDGFLSWERLCRGISGARCFHASIWSGSGEAFGLLAEGLAVALVAMFVVRRSWRTSFSGPLVVVAAGLLCAGAVKATFVLGNASINQRSISPPSPVAPGTWLGIAVLVLTGFVLLIAFTRPERRLRLLVPFGVTVALLVGLAIPYGWSGLGWWGGPLATPSFLGGGNGLGILAPPGHRRLFDGLLYVENRSPMTVTLDGLDFVGLEPRYRILGTYVVEAGPCGDDAVDVGVREPGRCAYPLPGRRIEARQHDEFALAAVIETPRPGVYRTQWFRIRYHVGPLHLEVFRTDEFIVCAPMPGRERCRHAGL